VCCLGWKDHVLECVRFKVLVPKVQKNPDGPAIMASRRKPIENLFELIQFVLMLKAEDTLCRICIRFLPVICQV
jgi:hypothetical protein